MSPALAAIDLGASSGRVMAATIEGNRIRLRQAARFPNRAVRAGGRLYWDLFGLWNGVIEGLRALDDDTAAVAVDSWAVDYALLDADGHLLSVPVCYRDNRTREPRRRLLHQAGEAALFARTGIQHQPFNTIFQLASEPQQTLAAADRLLLVPDLFGYWLSGQAVCEATNASTTGLVDHATGDWSDELRELAGVPEGLLARLAPTGTVLGGLTDDVAADTGLTGTDVIATASHDTASAVSAVPYESDNAAYISCGTWSLVGSERTSPVLSAEAMRAGFTNERGADGTIRFLRNVAGLWLLQESLRTWERAGERTDLAGLLAAAAEVPRLRSVVDPDDPAFAEPGDMPERLRQYCRRTGQPVPDTPVEVTACILDSLALAHRRAVTALEDLTGDRIDTVHIVGGGANNELLCRLTADATGRPVLAGPDEATALGNALVQAQALGLIAPGPDARREAARASAEPRRHLPSGQTRMWERASAFLEDHPARAGHQLNRS